MHTAYWLFIIFIGSHGKNVLPSIVQGNLDEYFMLTREEKDSLVKELEEHRATMATGRRISTKSKINDVASTIRMIEKEVRVVFYSLFSVIDFGHHFKFSPAS